jgi:hypothetical protein
MGNHEGLDPADRTPPLGEDDHARVIADFAVGPAGVGPVMGFDSGDFFPAASEAVLERNQSPSSSDDHDGEHRGTPPIHRAVVSVKAGAGEASAVTGAVAATAAIRGSEGDGDGDDAIEGPATLDVDTP